MYDPGLAILLMWHVGSIVVWLGVSLTFSFVLSPSLRSIDATARKALFCALFPKLSKLLGLSSASAILAGGIMYAYLATVDTSHVPNGLGFIFITIGAMFGLVAAIITLGAVLPQGSKLVRIMSSEHGYIRDSKTKEGTPDEETMLGTVGSALTGVSVILATVFVFMVLGANL